MVQPLSKTIDLNLTPTWVYDPFKLNGQLSASIKEFAQKIDPLKDFSDEIVTANKQFLIRRHESTNATTGVSYLTNLNNQVRKLISNLMNEVKQLFTAFGKIQLWNEQEYFKDIQNALAEGFSKHPQVLQLYEGLETCFNISFEEIKVIVVSGDNHEPEAKSLFSSTHKYKYSQEDLWNTFIKKVTGYFGEVPDQLFLSTFHAKIPVLLEETFLVNTFWLSFVQDHKTFENTIYQDLTNILKTNYGNGFVLGLDPEMVGGEENLMSLYMIILCSNFTELNQDKYEKTLNTVATFYNMYIVGYKEQFPLLGQMTELLVNQQNNPAQRPTQLTSYLQFYSQQWKTKTNLTQNLYAMAAIFISFLFMDQHGSGSGDTYTPHLRYLLKSIFRNLKNGETQFSNFQILCCLEHLVETACQKLQSAVIQVDPNVTNIQTVQKTIRSTRIQTLEEHLNHVNQVKSLQFDQKLAIPKKFFLETLSQKPSKSLLICVSGFTSEDCLKSEEWATMLDIYPYSELLALNWNSSSAKNVVNSAIDAFTSNAGNALKNAGGGLFGKLMAGGMAAYKAVNTVKDNVWGDAYQEAQATGIYLAHLLARIEIFRGYSISLVGFSLGTLVITCCLQELKKMGREDVIYDVVLMGGVANVNDYDDELLKVIGHKMINCYCHKDQVLKGAFKVAHPDINPVGLNPIASKQAKVENADVTEISPGHLEYRSCLAKIFARVEFNEDYRYMLKM